MLGDISAITISTPDLEKSFRFYKQLGFEEILRYDLPFPFIQISDGALLIMLRKDDGPYISLTYYIKELEKTVSELESNGVSFASKTNLGDMIRRCIIQSPDGLNIALVTYVDGFAQPPGPTMLTTDPANYFKPDTYVNKISGLFGEFAHPVKDLEVSILFWEKLGFKTLSKYSSPYPWAIISDGLSVVGLHQTEDFNYPAITFFASDMAEKINRLINDGLENYTNQGSNGNIVITTPEQQHIFLFKLGR